MVDPVVQLAGRQGPVALEDPEPVRVGREPAERHRARRSAAPARIRSISPCQYGIISATWARTSGGPQVGLGRIVEALGERPRRAVHDAWTGRAESRRTIVHPLEQGVVAHGGQCRTSGVAWVSTTTQPRTAGEPDMTETVSRGAANQAGARIDTDAYAKAEDFLPLKGIDHVEFWVGNARQAAAYYRALWGFTPVAFSGLETKVRDRASYVMVQNGIRFVFTAPLTPDGEIAEHVREHGDGVHDIAFAGGRRRVGLARDDDARRGLRAHPDRDRWRRRRHPAQVVHPDVRRDAALVRGSDRLSRRVRARAIARSRAPAAAAGGLSLLEVDHCVGNVELGQMDTFVDYYRDVLGFAQLIHYDDKVIHTEYSALMSKVMTNGNGRVKFPINEPAAGKKKSQIQEYLDWYRSPGCQHIALRTEDIVGTVRRLRDNGIEFLGLPHEYYATLADRVGDVGVPIDTLEELGIEADRDEEGYLLQIFTRPVQDRPTFFFEIIERHGSRGFGVGNFKALFEAIEREQAKRGNL